ncbi:Phenylacetic acid degradation protein PaaI [Cupriavidus necator]|uniref:Medium/long-chain acyl-CoA thioesterase YigI n=1 Tax=Cupriavidus necator (strain ATCC 17699 / DSM 428 / KCTC 22496 / NCIMB 10442 / H16 / Stanier 337) TaxID=381666 RepID=Q0KBG0_CUPNH|nr:MULTISPECIES: PaaI family thioesterase [Cupriavidus]EON20454.1 phenylacetic acid degradation protein PaaI [Cupriavidus sp. GA3-3]KUE88717.1 phenylacetic acid degradation protein [Cupriavidus necator]QCC00538.1 PaaI family thioesterase [Cupriavidus necator H16]QQB76643.1 PaaI family thioesterase [Cupriavidus necator]WKA42402.1 PaaI family thioesterase [Cupriavidus necator]
MSAAGTARATPADMLAWGREVLASQPFSVLVGTELAALSPGKAELRLPIRQDLRQQHGFLHGGVVSYLADNALTYAGGAAMAVPVVTSEYKINYVRPAIGELLVARAECVSAGRQQAVVRCDVYVVRDGEERLCAVAQGTIARLGEGA